MYGVLCVLVMTGLFFLTVLELRTPRKWLTVTEGILCGTGILLHPVLLLVLQGLLSSCEAGFASWAWDSMTTYLRYALPALGVFFGIPFFCALSPLWAGVTERKVIKQLSIKKPPGPDYAREVKTVQFKGFPEGRPHGRTCHCRRR